MGNSGSWLDFVGDVLRASTRIQSWSGVSQRPHFHEIIESPTFHNLPRYKQGKVKLWLLRKVSEKQQ